MMRKEKKIIMSENIESPIKHHIKEIDKKLKQKYLSRTKKSLKSQMDMNKIQKQYQRMKFMGIPIRITSTIEAENLKCEILGKNSHAEKSLSSCEMKEVYDNDDKLTSKDKHLNSKIVPEAVKLIPKIPSLCYDVSEDEYEQSKVVHKPFTKAHPRGNNPQMLRIDKSLPWIEDEINLAKVKFQNDYDEMKWDSHNVPIDNWNHVSIDSDTESKRMKKSIADKNQSELKKNFNNLIASKLKDYKNSAGIELKNDENDNVHAAADDYDVEMKSVQSDSTLSSNGTYFTNDSGSYILILDEKIPKSQINIGKKFQVLVLFI